jgi:VIT1/CCC1 family predicted Fe2+/Mn2+ transporter
MDSQTTAIASKLNWLRAGVLGANDGIVSTASIIFGVAGASAGRSTLVLAGIAAIAAGAMSMAVGEYVSVASQRDVEEAELEREKNEIEDDPKGEIKELSAMLQKRGINPELSGQVARELTNKDALKAHARLELGIDPEAIVNPFHAAFASMIAFTTGGLVPLVAVLASRQDQEIWVCGAAVVVALALSGWISARLGRTPYFKSMFRTVSGGLLGMAITFAIGRIAGTRV